MSTPGCMSNQSTHGMTSRVNLYLNVANASSCNAAGGDVTVVSAMWPGVAVTNVNLATLGFPAVINAAVTVKV